MAAIRVLVVDDSPFMRHTVARLIGEADGIVVVGTAGDGEAGLRETMRLHPDVITLDVEMPVLDGLGMLRRLMVECPTRVVMLSSLTAAGAAVTLDALAAGAVDFVLKPSGSLSVDMVRVRDDLVARIRAAAAIPEAAFLAHRLAARSRAPSAAGWRGAAAPGPRPVTDGPGTEPPAASGRPDQPAVEPARRLVVVASSTGGPGALQVLVGGLPGRLGAAMLIVQHMPPHFTASLAARLDTLSGLPVREAAVGDVLAEDQVLVAPGGTHLLLTPRGRVELAALAPVNGVRPAADVTLQALAPIWGERALLVVLTGMGADAREGARALRAHRGTVYAQDERTSIVFGMPGAVIAAGLAEQVLPLPEIPAAIARWCGAGDAWAGDGERSVARAAMALPRVG